MVVWDGGDGGGGGVNGDLAAEESVIAWSIHYSIEMIFNFV